MEDTIHQFNSPMIAALQRLHPGVPPRKAVRKLAVDLHHTFHVSGPPFNPFQFARHLDVPVVFGNIEAEGVLTDGGALRRFIEEGEDPPVDAPPIAAFIDDKDTGPRIVLRSSQYGAGKAESSRRWFTLAHEIGHFVIRRDVSSYMSSFRCDDPEEEHLCNAFAGELLMPGFKFGDDISQLGLNPLALLELRERYAVSLTALLARVAEIFDDQVILGIWKRERAGLVMNWCGPTQFRRAVLCNTGSTPIEKAFRHRRIEVGRCDVLLDGERLRWCTVAMRLGEGKVLSVMHRRLEDLDRFLPIRPDLMFGPFEDSQMNLDLREERSSLGRREKGQSFRRPMGLRRPPRVESNVPVPRSLLAG